MILGSTLQLILKKYSLVSFLMSKKNIQDDLNRLLKQPSFFQLHIFMDPSFLLNFIFLICFSQSSELQQTECQSRYENCGLFPLQYSCLENPMDEGAWQAAVHGTAKSQARLGDFTFTFMHWRKGWQSTPMFLPGESQGPQSLVGCRLQGCTESGMTEATQQQTLIRGRNKLQLQRQKSFSQAR